MDTIIVYCNNKVILVLHVWRTDIYYSWMFTLTCAIAFSYNLSFYFLQHWTKVQSTGTIPTARSTHAACCLGYTLTGQHSSLMVVGGWSGSTVLSDVWLLDVTNWSWSEVWNYNTSLKIDKLNKENVGIAYIGDNI